MAKSLSQLLRREQFAFLGRDRSGWAPHLDRVRAFLGEGLQAADPARPVLVLGAGSGLEIPWAVAPAQTTGWDADPWSRAWTLLRHRRWVPWVFGDLTGGLDALAAAAQRCAAEPWSRRRREPEQAAKRLAGLVGSLVPIPAPLQRWIQEHRPGTILVANVMGQFGGVVQQIAEKTLGLEGLERDPDQPDPLGIALEAWTLRALRAFLDTLRDSGADLWLVHDRAVIFNEGPLTLGPWADDWKWQLFQGAEQPLEVHDPLMGLEVPARLGTPSVLARRERWLWDLAPGQRHLMEALAWVPLAGRASVATVNPCPQRAPQQP